MSIYVQQIIVSVIVLLSVVWLVWQIIVRLRRSKDADACNCEGCPFANCASRYVEKKNKKNIKNDCKKIGQNVA